MDPRRIFKYLSHVIVGHRAVKQNSPLLNLPLDVVYAIMDELQIPAKIMLSQTCRSLWYGFRENCSSALQTATTVERLGHLAVLGDLLPDHRLCTGCRSLHPVDYEDIPIAGFCNYYKPCPSPEPMWSRHRLSPYYAIAFRHVHLAMKYTRLEEHHQRYRATILQRFSVFSPNLDSIAQNFIAKPVVVCGRFILMTDFHFYGGIKPLSYSTLLQTSVLFCPHHSLGPLSDPKDPLITAIRFAFGLTDGANGLNYATYSCDRCPTDYSIMITDQSASVSVWHDLGTGASPEDPCWRSHIWTEENGHYKSAKFNYEHGSVRELYYSNGIQA